MTRWSTRQNSIGQIFYNNYGVQLKSLKEQGVETAEVESRLKSELDEWRTDRNTLHQAKVAANRFEVENRNLQREMLSLQVPHKFCRKIKLAEKILPKEK